MAGRVSVGVIGLGYWGPNLVRAFSELPQADLRVCADVDQARTARIAARYPGVKTTTDVGTVLDNADIDAVVIASSAVTHYDMGRQALLAGKHVFIEKPLALNKAEAEELIGMAREAGRVLMVGHLLLYHPAVRLLKNYLDNGDIGQISYLYAERLNLGKIRQDENCLWSLAPHDISVIMYLLGREPLSVTTVGECYLQPGVEDVVFLTLHFPDKVMANVHISWLDPHKVRRLTMVGTKKMAVFDDMEPTDKVKIYDHGAGPPQDYRSYGEDLTLRFGDISLPRVAMEEPLKVECAHFLDCAATGRTPLSGGETGLQVVKVLEAAQESMKKEGCPVNV